MMQFKTADDIRAYFYGRTAALNASNVKSMRASGASEESIEAMAAHNNAECERACEEVIALMEAAQEEFNAPRVLN